MTSGANAYRIKKKKNKNVLRWKIVCGKKIFSKLTMLQFQQKQRRFEKSNKDIGNTNCKNVCKNKYMYTKQNDTRK